jgi:hypothetical protein
MSEEELAFAQQCGIILACQVNLLLHSLGLSPLIAITGRVRS